MTIPAHSSEEPNTPYLWWVFPEAVGPRVRRGMRTIDAVREDPVELAELNRLIERASDALHEIEYAASVRPPGMARRTALAFTLSRNSISGESGLIVRRWLPGDCYSRPIAELLAIQPAVTEASKSSADLLTRGALNEWLEIFVLEQYAEPNPCPVVFTGICSEEEDDEGQDVDAVYYIARLLVTPFEVGQWLDDLVEARGGRMQ